MKNRKLLLVIPSVFLIVVLSIVTSSAATLGSPQTLDGLQSANITHYWGDSFTFNDTLLSAEDVVTLPYGAGLDLSSVIMANSPGYNTKIRFSFVFPSALDMDFNALIISNVPSNFNITISASGISSMTGQPYSQSFAPVNQAGEWTLYDTYSFSATQTPVFSKITSLSITIDGGIVVLSSLSNSSIVLSLSTLPYDLQLDSDSMYKQGYSDASEIYAARLESAKQSALETGKKLGFDDGYAKAEEELVEPAYQQGKREGIDIGREQGALATQYDLKDLIFSIPEAHLTSLSGFLNWELLGYNLYDTLGGIVTLLVIGALVTLGIKVLV